MDGTTDFSTKYHVFNVVLKQFDKTTLKELRIHHFRSNSIQFVLVSIQKYDNNIHEQSKKKQDDTFSTSKWNFQNSIPLKTFPLYSQDRLPLKHIG